MRLQKYMAYSGVASRRKSEDIIRGARVQVNENLILDPAFKVGENDIVRVDGEIISLRDENIYYLLNKPLNIISTSDDEFGRKNVLDLINTNKRVYPVGRLDMDSTGLIILTNDGVLTNILTHPKYRINKKYIVKVQGIPKEEELDILRKGIVMDGSPNNRSKIKFLGHENKNAILEVIINEGKNRQIRRMFEFISYGVIDLKRIEIGKIRLRNLKEGKSRPFNKDELKYVKKLKRIYDE